MTDPSFSISERDEIIILIKEYLAQLRAQTSPVNIAMIAIRVGELGKQLRDKVNNV